jgi:predicted RNA-binding Zn ribbon-like protein
LCEVRQTLRGARDFILLSGGHPAIDLCNTRLGEEDLLVGPGDLARWFVAAGVTDQPPALGPADVAAARALRDGLREALLTADGSRVARIAEGWLGGAPGRLRVEEDTLRPRFSPGERTSCCLLVGAVLDALDLVRDAPGRVRECADASCPVLYLDTSRNGSRRWCSMEGCGARAKSAAYYRRRRGR